MNLKLLLQPSDSEPVELKEVKGQFERKTPGQRLRACLFIHWKQCGETGEFEDHYRRQMELLINSVKSKLEDKT